MTSQATNKATVNTADGMHEIVEDISSSNVVDGPENEEYVEEYSETDDDGESYGSDDEIFDPLGGLGQLLITEEGETLVDVLAGIRDVLGETYKCIHVIAKTMKAKKEEEPATAHTKTKKHH